MFAQLEGNLSFRLSVIGGLKMSNSRIPKIFTTKEAAAYLNRKPQTLRKWHCHGTGPIQPIRIGGRLGWKSEDIMALLKGEINGQ